MNDYIDIIKGIHPGKYIRRDLRKRNISQRKLAEQTNIPYQTINAIIAARRSLTTEQALKIERVLGYDEAFLALLQTYFDVEKLKEKELENLFSGVPRIRKSLFWDADFDTINWGKHKKAVVKRVLERGSDNEIKEIIRFYDLSKSEVQDYKMKKSPINELSENKNQ